MQKLLRVDKCESRFVRKMVALIIFLWCFRVFLCWYGFNRLPISSGNDEVMLGDVSLALSRGQGLAAPSYEGTIIGSFYAHHMPVFTIVQALMLRVFGFSILTLRFVGITSHLLWVLLLMITLLILWREKVVDRFAVICSFGLLIFDFVTFWNARMARMEPLAALFGTVALTILSAKNSIILFKGKTWIAAGIFLGLAVSTHPSALFFYVVYLVMLWQQRRNIHWLTFLVFAIVPFLVLSCIWVALYQERAIEALSQFLELCGTEVQRGFSFQKFFDSIFAFSPRLFIEVGGPIYFLLFIVWIILIVKIIKINQANLNREKIYIFVLSIVGHVFLIFYVTGIAQKRLSVLFPILVLMFAYGISHISLGMKKILGVVVVLLLSLNVILLSGYFYKLRNEYHLRGPDRFDMLIKPWKGLKIAATPLFWYACQKFGMPIRVVELGFVHGQHYWQDHADSINQFDIIILPKDHPLNPFVFLKDRSVKSLRDLGIDYFIYERKNTFLYNHSMILK